jgi:sec-independent protein translocase protein TatC
MARPAPDAQVTGDSTPEAPGPPPGDEEGGGLFGRGDPSFEHTRMTIGDHLEDLRKRIFKAVIILLVGFFPWWAASEWLVEIVTQPLFARLSEDVLVTFRFIAIKPQETFMVHLEVAFIADLITTAPITFILLWGFIAAGLYPHERKWVNFFAPATLIGFVAGVLFLYFVVMPFIMEFLVGFWQHDKYQPTISIGAYITFFLWMSLLMGLVFQTPLVMMFLTLVGLVGPRGFASKRRHVIAGAVIVAAVLTPPDVISQVMTAGPFIVLYEVGIVAGRFIEAGRRRKNAA